MKKILFLFSLILASALSQLTFAQSNPLYIEQYPKQLKAEEDVFFTLKASEDFSLSDMKITWKIDGTTYDEGVGRTTFKTKAPKQNIERTVAAYVEIPGSTSAYVSTVLRASPFILLYEGENSVTPAFYKGRKLPGKEGSARIGVFTTGKGYSTEFNINNSKTTSQNNTVIASGRITESTLDVVANIKQNGESAAFLEKKIVLQRPEVLLFRENRTTSLQTPISGSERGGDIYVSAEPYFFFGKNKYDSKVRYVWKINEQNKNVSEPWFIKLSSTNKETLQARLEVRQVEKVTQRAEKIFSAIFE